MREKAIGIFICLLGLAIALALLYQPPPAPEAQTTTVIPPKTPSVPTNAAPLVSQAPIVSPKPAPPVVPTPTNAAPAVTQTPPPPATNAVVAIPTPPSVPPSVPVLPIPEHLAPPAEGEPHLQIVSSGPSNSRQIALTFDDGPHPTITLKVLDILRERGVKATFFVLGDRVKQYPWILRQIVAEGHEIGNHTYSHRWLTPMSNELIDQDITETQDAIKNAIGYETHLFRPPYGAFRKDTKAVFLEHGLSIVLWSVDPMDWRFHDSNRIFQTITNQTRNGSIILCHDIHPTTLKALPEILDNLLAQGYQFTTVSRLCGLPELTLVKSTNTPPVSPVSNPNPKP